MNSLFLKPVTNSIMFQSIMFKAMNLMNCHFLWDCLQSLCGMYDLFWSKWNIVGWR